MRMATWRAFGLGVLVGLMAAGAVAAMQLMLLQRRGVEVHVDTTRIALQVQAEVRDALKRELPAAIAQLRREVPARAAAETARRLGETRLHIGGFSMPVPEVAVMQVQAGVEEALRVGLDAAVRNADVDSLSRRLGDQAYVLVDHGLGQMLAGQRFIVKPWPWLSVPVTVRTN